LREFEILQDNHRESELNVVVLSDELEKLRIQVETNSLTAQVRKELDDGRQAIEDVNLSIEQNNCKATALDTEIKAIHTRIGLLQKKLKDCDAQTQHLNGLRRTLMAQKERLKKEVVKCIEAAEDGGGENIALRQKLASGLGFEPGGVAGIRKDMLALKGDLRKLDCIEEDLEQFERGLLQEEVCPAELPPRKRVPLIPTPRRH
jgi:chromosome segregation ATPase